MANPNTTGFPVLTDAQIRVGQTLDLDTNFAGGAAPQSATITVGQSGAFMQIGVLAAVAFAGGGQTNATPLGYGINTVATVATAADSVRLPASVQGRVVFIRNISANATTVFGAGTDTINGVATATGVSQAATSGVFYVCTAGDGSAVGGTWVRL